MTKFPVFRTLTFQVVPAGQAETAGITINIRKYYDNNAVRIHGCWHWANYTDVTALSSSVAADTLVTFGGVRNMQIPAADLTTTSGAVTLLNAAIIPGLTAGEFNIYGDAILESPIFTMTVDFFKRASGGYPAAFQFIGFVTVQLEFNVDDLSEGGAFIQ